MVRSAAIKKMQEKITSLASAFPHVFCVYTAIRGDVKGTVLLTTFVPKVVRRTVPLTSHSPYTILCASPINTGTNIKDNTQPSTMKTGSIPTIAMIHAMIG